MAIGAKSYRIRCVRTEFPKPNGTPERDVARAVSTGLGGITLLPNPMEALQLFSKKVLILRSRNQRV